MTISLLKNIKGSKSVIFRDTKGFILAVTNSPHILKEYRGEITHSDFYYLVKFSEEKDYICVDKKYLEFL